MDYHENAKDIAVIKEMLKKNSEELQIIRQSYGTLNECHNVLENKFTVMTTEWRTTKDIIKWIAGGSAATLILTMVQLLRLFKVI